MDAVAVVVDNGEELLEQSLRSLRKQTVRPYIIVASGPNTDFRTAERYADEVLEPEDGIGKARVKAILSSDQEYIFSCDSDTVYAPNYVEEGIKALKIFDIVKAGCINPYDDHDLIAVAEAWVASFAYPYEFALAFRRGKFFELGLDRQKYEGRLDIGHFIPLFTFIPSIPTMVCWTRLPTLYVEREVADKLIFRGVK